MLELKGEAAQSVLISISGEIFTSYFSLSEQEHPTHCTLRANTIHQIRPRH